MKQRSFPLMIAALALAGLIAGCATEQLAAPAEAAAAPSATARATNIVDFGGVRDVAFGESADELTARGALDRPQAACGPALPRITEASPVIADGQLVLVWANPPLKTPEGVGVGTSVADLRAAYPQATALTAPAGSYQFDGLMVTHGDRAYLFLHDGQTVRKTVAGFTQDAQKLFDTGFGSC